MSRNVPYRDLRSGRASQGLSPAVHTQYLDHGSRAFQPLCLLSGLYIYRIGWARPSVALYDP